MENKKATLDHPIHALLAERWSPCAFADRPVPHSELLSLFEAVRWAPSSYNEQPWSYLVAAKEDAGEFARTLSCLVEPNQAWAKAAPVLALGLTSLKFSHNQKENRVALHDLGLASANLSIEATARGLSVHQMAGILPDKVRELYQLPKDVEAFTGLAIGYKGDSEKLPDNLKQRDLAPRERKPLSKFVFTGRWGQPASFLSK
jgi:nitroreductase